MLPTPVPLLFPAVPQMLESRPGVAIFRTDVHGWDQSKHAERYCQALTDGRQGKDKMRGFMPQRTARLQEL